MHTPWRGQQAAHAACPAGQPGNAGSRGKVREQQWDLLPETGSTRVPVPPAGAALGVWEKTGELGKLAWPSKWHQQEQPALTGVREWVGRGRSLRDKDSPAS